MLLDVQGHDSAARPRPAQMTCVGAGQSALAGLPSPQPGLLNVGVQRVGQGQLPLVPHPRARYLSARQTHGLVGPPIAELERGRDHRRRRRFGIEPVRVAEVDQVEVRREPVGDRLFQLRRRRHSHRSGEYGGHVIQQHDADNHSRPTRPPPLPWRFRDRPKSRLRNQPDPRSVPPPPAPSGLMSPEIPADPAAYSP